MAETTSSKRFREEEEEAAQAEMKRQRSFNDILSLLESDEEEPIEDVSSLITTLQEELSSSPSDALPEPTLEPEQLGSSSGDLNEGVSSSSSPLTEEAEAEEVIRHLLEASDDELGIPQEVENQRVEGVGGLEGISAYDGYFLEIEDEAANYYTMLQSELFL